MPFVSNMQDAEPEDKKNQPQGPQGSISPGAGGGAVRLAPSGAVPAGGASSGSGATAAGGQFAGLGQYLKANAGNAEPLAGKLTTNIGKEYTGLEGQNQQTLSSIGGQVAANPSYANANDIIAQEAANPASFTSTPDNVASFQNLLKASYSGPASVESTNEYANQQANINKAISQGQASTQTEAGREGLLAKNENQPNAGVTALNSAILSKSPTALTSIEAAYKPFQNLLSSLQSGAAETNKTIAQKRTQAEAANKNANEALSAQQSTLNKDVNEELAQAQQMATARNTAVNNELQNIYGGTPLNTAATTLGTYGGGSVPWVNTTNYSVNALTPETAAALGMTPEQAEQLQNALAQAATSQYMTGHNFGAGSGTAQLDLGSYLSQIDPTKAITTANIATPEQYARQQAFQTLLGALPFGNVLNPNEAAQAGTAPTKLNQFNYNQATTDAQQAAAEERQAAQAMADALTNSANAAHEASKSHTFGGNLLKNLKLGGQYLANPLSAVPKELTAGKKLVNKV